VSKIEDALKKVGGGRSLRSGTAPDGTQRQLARVPQPNPSSTSLTQRANSRSEIARMVETSPMSDEEMARGKIIHSDMDDGRVLNAFRELRTKIVQNSLNGNGVIMVTGIGFGDGASFVARNLAAAFALDESKTALLLDCNFKNPQASSTRNSDVKLGLTDYLESEEMPVEKIIHQAGIDRFRLIPSGAHCEVPAEYFTSVRMTRLLTQLKQRYPERYVILDTPPITESADTTIVAAMCDHVLLVVPYGKVTQSQVEAALKSVDKNKLLGVVFNNEPQLPPLSLWKSLWRRKPA
jgi:capsular exopolysaccharide synthesis family protein